MEHTRTLTDSAGKAYVLFANGWSPLSASYPSPIKNHGVRYRSPMQMYQAMKAKQFGDLTAYRMIMKSWSSKTQMDIGGTIENYEPSVWDQKADDVMESALRLKFEQNEKVKQFLLQTGDAVIVYCSETQTHWGSGLKSDDAESNMDPTKWKGENKLGQLLMKIRQEFC
jgi:ribA/ribD-fused uncharacterized protein